MQNQDMTFKDAIKVPIRQVIRARAKKIADAVNILIQVIEESEHM